MSVLDSIIEGVRQDEQSRRLSDSVLSSRIANAPKPISAITELSRRAFSVIAEIKRSSPSKGDLSEISDPATLAKLYEENGASVISVLTEQRRFKGSLTDFAEVRSAVKLPMLRKDFMVSEYLIRESRAYGADLILLIVAALDDYQLRDFHQLSEGLGMEVLVEVHDEIELERALAISPKIIGVNSRNLKTLEVDTSSFARIIPLIPRELIKIAESGISEVGDIRKAREAGAHAALVGEALVKSSNPGVMLQEFLSGANSE